jgi:hypothetical protein
MGDRGGVSYAVSGETTEWEDILIKKGIVEKDDVLRGKGIDPEMLRLEEAVRDAEEVEVERMQSLSLQDKLAQKTLEELEEAEDDFQDDEEEEIFARMRQERLAVLKTEAAAARFGEVREISKQEWMREVTEGSKECSVVVHLFQNSVVECNLLTEALTVVAKKFPKVKFLRIRSTSAVENWPDSNLPTIFVYTDGALATQLIGVGELGGKRLTALDVEWWLARKGLVESDLEANPRESAGVNEVNIRRGNRSNSDDSD